LVTSIQGLEQLLGQTRSDASDRPKLLRRLAETYVELEETALREKTQAEIDRDNAKATSPDVAAQKQQLANQRDTTMVRARKSALKYYSDLATSFPNDPQTDEVLYYTAYEYEQANELSEARRAYLDIITKYPNSKYVPTAYLAFGELFFDEAQQDPSKWDAAKQAYQKVITYPPPDNRVYAYAWYKLGYVFWNRGDLPHALDAFKKVIDHGGQYSSLPGAATLATAARHDAIAVFALAGSPASAYNFFKVVSGDAAGTNTATFKMMNELGSIYVKTGHYAEGITLYLDLEVRDGGDLDKRCGYQTQVRSITCTMKRNDTTAVQKLCPDLSE
jgi:tetratricopeptide (TPR) repeat protein